MPLSGSWSGSHCQQKSGIKMQNKICLRLIFLIHSYDFTFLSLCPQLVKVSVDQDGQRERGHLRHLAGVRYMFNLAQLHQAYSAHVLYLNNPALLLDDLEELEGPHSYLRISQINR